MVEDDGYDIRPLLDLAEGARTGHVRGSQQLFESMVKICVEHLPYQVADVLTFDRSASCLRRVVAAFRRPDAATKLYTTDALKTLGTVNISIDDIFKRPDEDKFLAKMHREVVGGNLKLGPVDVNVYTLERPSMSTTALRQTTAYDDLRQAYLDGKPVDPLYIIAYEEVHRDDLAAGASKLLLRSMLVAPFCSPGDLMVRDGSRLVRGDLVGKLRLLNRTRSTTEFGAAECTPFDRALATVIAQTVFLAYLERESRPVIARRTTHLVKLADLPPRKPFVDGTEILGSCEALRCCVYLARKAAARRNVSVLLGGETGTGKGALARTIHTLSNRSSSPFMKIECSKLEKTTLESELFGYEKGAFTDAKAQKKGLLELAHGGTVFLDEIGEMALSVQAKLLGFLDEKTFRRLGGTCEIPVDVRIVAATNRVLPDEVKEGRFREDLFHRLNVISIVSPPLRERDREDILMLLRYWFEEKAEDNERNRLADLCFRQEVLERVTQYHWGGNVRQLCNAVEYMLTCTTGEIIEVDHLPPWLRQPDNPETPTDALNRNSTYSKAERSAAPHRKEGRGSLADKNDEEIMAALREHNGNVAAAARELQVGRNTLDGWIKNKGKREDVDGMRE